ncbi:MAG: SDR family NAD(P)-dependent oxidoreductase [Candidatus Levybacteria bacterium]|nr:SDR family NAD(P)-dependent oxidoreductase [Candidatus Levybacteria bacterium]
MKKRKNILVTGGAGFIGSHMARRLLDEGNKVTVFDNLSTGIKSYIPKAADFILGDVKEEKDVKKVFSKKFDVVFHIAGCASTINSFADPLMDIKTNFIGTVNVVKQCIEKSVPRLLYASSMTVYGHPKRIPIDEESPTKPISYYGIAKYSAERFVHATAQRIDLNAPFNATSFRMFNVYGERQSLTNPYQGVMAIFIGNVLRKEPIVIFGDGKQSRDFVFIDDVVDAWVQNINNKKTFGEIFNLGYGTDISINELTETIIKTIGFDAKKYKVIYKKARPGDQRHMRADVSKLKKMANWKPKYNLEEGLKKTIEWAKKEA